MIVTSVSSNHDDDHYLMTMMVIIMRILYDDDSDQEGRPTRDPRKYKDGGALLPAGGPKV